MKSWVIYIVAALGFAAYGVISDADRDESGAIVGGGSVDAFNMRVGDCFEETVTYSEEVSSVPGVPCADPHDYETFAVFDVSLNSYPDEDTMAQLAFESCMEHFETFVGRDYESSSLDITTMFPTQESWNQSDREIVCALFDVEANKLIGSAKGRGL